MNPVRELSAHGQSCWMDDLTRQMIASGNLAQRIAEDDLRGVTSNPSIFAKALGQEDRYAGDIAAAAKAGQSPQQIYEGLITTDVCQACGVFREVYDRTQGQDGFVSLEVSPHLAHDTQASVEEARRLWNRVNRPNLFIKIPGTLAGVPAIEQLLFEGINVNITLLFSVARYEAVAEAYLRALERRVEAGQNLDRLASVASFFLSRIDVLVDRMLEQRIIPDRSPPDPDPRGLLGKAAVANAKLAYRSFEQLVASARWKALEDRGARVQRLLWASTSTKNPSYPDLMYVEPLIGRRTINTMPEKTIAALRDHGHVHDQTIRQGLPEAERVMADLERLGIRFERVTDELEYEGVQKFIEAYDGLIAQLGAARAHVSS